MKTEEAKHILASISTDQQTLLSDAHSRYMLFTRIWDDNRDAARQAQVAADRAAYPHLLEYSSEGRPSISDAMIGEFMHVVSGLPVEWCLAFDAVDFEKEHGLSFEEFAQRAKKREISARLEAEHDESFEQIP